MPPHPVLIAASAAQLKRTTYPNGNVVVNTLAAYEEMFLDDVKLSELAALQLLVFSKTLLWQTSADTVVSAHGWRGALNFKKACATLHDIDIDHAEEELFLSLADPDRDALLLIDYDDADVDIKLGVLAAPTAMAKAFDLTIARHPAVRKASDLYTVPRPKCEGALREVARGATGSGRNGPRRAPPKLNPTPRQPRHPPAPPPNRQVRLLAHPAAGRRAVRHRAVRHPHLLLLRRQHAAAAAAVRRADRAGAGDAARRRRQRRVHGAAPAFTAAAPPSVLPARRRAPALTADKPDAAS